MRVRTRFFRFSARAYVILVVCLAMNVAAYRARDARITFAIAGGFLLLSVAPLGLLAVRLWRIPER
jgi:hypothetical protein